MDTAKMSAETTGKAIFVSEEINVNVDTRRVVVKRPKPWEPWDCIVRELGPRLSSIFSLLRTRALSLLFVYVRVCVLTYLPACLLACALMCAC